MCTVLPAALATLDANDNGPEAALAGGPQIGIARPFFNVITALNSEDTCLELTHTEPTVIGGRSGDVFDLAEVGDQAQAKRALEVAAAGGRALFMVGPPGAFKAMLAARLPGLLSAMNHTEPVELTDISSISGIGFNPGNRDQRPYRETHHTAPGMALV